MCSVSKVNELLAVSGTARAAGVAVDHEPPQVSAGKLKHSREQFFVVDIREPDEIVQDPADDSGGTAGGSLPVADTQVTTGKLLHMAGTKEGRAAITDDNKKQIVLLCGSGYRSTIVARELNKKYQNTGSSSVAVLTRGLVGLLNPAATVPDLLVVLATKSSGEKITLALNACAVASSKGNETVVLALMGEGVCTFLRKGNNKEEASATSLRVEETFVGEPFQPCHTILTQWIGTGNGVVLACTSCCKSRNIEFGSDLLDVVHPMQMPDLLRMLGEAKKTLQFM